MPTQRKQANERTVELAPLPRSAEPALNALLSGVERVQRKEALLNALLESGEAFLKEGKREAFETALTEMKRFRAERRAA